MNRDDSGDISVNAMLATYKQTVDNMNTVITMQKADIKDIIFEIKES